MRLEVFCASAMVCLMSMALLAPAAAPPEPPGDPGIGVGGELVGEFELRTKIPPLPGLKGRSEAHGSIVTFGFDGATGTITQFHYDRGAANVTAFDSVSIDPTAAMAARVNGSVFVAEGGEARIEVHDNPAAVMKHASGNVSLRVVYDLADGIGADAVSATRANLTGFDGRIWVAGNGSLSVSGDLVTVDLEAHSQSVFHAKPARPAKMELSADIAVEAVSAGEVLVDVASLEPGFDAEILTAQQSRIVVRLSSLDDEGRAVAVAFPTSMVPGPRVSIDGAVLTREAVLDGDRAEYAVVEEKGFTTVYVYVDHFSSRTVEIDRDPGSGGWLPWAMMGIVVALATASALVLVGSKRPRGGDR